MWYICPYRLGLLSKKGEFMGKDLKGKELGVGLNQRKDGRYQARFTTKNGKRMEKNFDKISDARDWLSKEKYLSNCIDNCGLTVDEWYTYWIKNFKESIVKENTVKNYKNRYLFNIKHEIGNMKLTEVKQIHCQQLLNRMYESGKYSYGTMELTAITMHAIFKGAIENEYILQNPATGIKIKKRDSDNEERRVLTREEQKILKKYSQKSLYHNAYMLVLETGLRAGEIGGLQWKDINFDEKYLVVKRTLLQDKNKGGFYFGDPKSKLSNRKIPLTEEAIKILQDQKQVQNRLKFNNEKWSAEWNGLIFTTINGNPVGTSTLTNMLNRIVCNINKDREIDRSTNEYEEFKHCYMHALRHTFATRCIENGMQPKILQKIMGHSTIQVTMDLYVHATDEQLFKEIEKMNVAI